MPPRRRFEIKSLLTEEGRACSAMLRQIRSFTFLKAVLPIQIGKSFSLAVLLVPQDQQAPQVPQEQTLRWLVQLGRLVRQVRQELQVLLERQEPLVLTQR